MNIVLTTVDWIALAPFLALSVLGILVLTLGLMFPRLYRESLAALVLIGLAVSLFFVLQNWGEAQFAFMNMIISDKFSAAFGCIFIIGAALTLLLSLNSLEQQYLQYADYFAMLIFATAGMVLMASGVDLISIFLGLETLSIALYVLAGSRRDNVMALESAFKYFLLGAFASGFLLYGIALLYGATGSTNLYAISSHIAQAGFGSSPMLLIGALLLFAGFGFKIAVFPFHMWAPDVYQGAPTPVAAFMATGSKAAGFAALLRIVLLFDVAANVQWQQILWLLAVLTMTVGNVIALRQENIKRMLAYSSIAHAGYILVGIIAENELGPSSVIFYLLSYMFMNIGAFGVVSFISGPERENVQIKDFCGLAYQRPFAALAMATFMFSLAGIPPTAGFISKFYIFSAGVKAGYLWLVIFGVINSMISLYYYLGVVVQMFMSTRDEAEPVKLAAHQPAVAVALSLAVLAVFELGIFPSRWLELFQEMARALL